MLSTEATTEYCRDRLTLVTDDRSYANDFHPNISIPNFRDTWEYLQAQESDPLILQVTCRVCNKREASKALIFFDVIGDGAASVDMNHLQIFCSKKLYDDTYYKCLSFNDIKYTVNRGDIIGVIGYPCRTARNELSLQCLGLRLLAPCLHEVPRALEDPTALRALCFIVDPLLKNVLRLRAKVLRFMRNYFDEEGFTEVDTPILVSDSGANAEPFQTYYRDIKKTLNLRVAPELSLKQMVIAGMGRIYEIGKQFRNEGRDRTHNPEFTSCEFYIPYATIEDVVHVTERILSGCAMVAEDMGVLAPEIDWAPPYNCFDVITELENITGHKINPSLPEDELYTLLYSLVLQHKLISPASKLSIPKLYDLLISGLLEPMCHNPTILYGHPSVMCPLAKPQADCPALSQRFELFVKGKELCNAYSELNNPVLQRQTLNDQLKLQKDGEKEVITCDVSYCRAMEYALPPTAGWGIGIDRLLMFLTNTGNISDVAWS